MAPEATKNSSVTFAEKLTPGFGWWVGAALLAGMTALSVYPVWHWGAVIVPVVSFLLLTWALLSMSKSVVVTGQEFYAGVAHIDRSLVGEVVPLDKRRAFLARGQDLDARAYLMTRPWVSAAVQVPIDDPADPTPYWIVSTRKPQELAAALNAGR